MRSARSAAVAVLLVLLAVPALAQDWQTISRSRAIAGERSLRVDVGYGAGRLTLAPAQPGVLYRTSMRFDADAFKPVMSYNNDRLRVGIESVEGGSIRGRNMRNGSLDLALSTEVPIDLELKFGAAEASLDLGGIRLNKAEISTGASKTTLTVSRPNPGICESFEIEVGAAQFEATGLGNLRARRLRMSGGVGEVTLDFTGEWQADMSAEIEMGLGSLTIRVPRGLGLRVQKDGLLAGFDSQGLIKRGDVYFSEDWDRATRRLTIKLDAALGAIRVAWVDG